MITQDCGPGPFSCSSSPEILGTPDEPMELGGGIPRK